MPSGKTQKQKKPQLGLVYDVAPPPPTLVFGNLATPERPKGDNSGSISFIRRKSAEDATPMNGPSSDVINVQLAPTASGLILTRDSDYCLDVNFRGIVPWADMTQMSSLDSS